MTAVKANLLQTMKFLVDFLDRHGLAYSAAYGTVLGAVRHKGFIPWDDDIDICMFRDHYERLLSLRPEMQKEGYDIVSYYDKGYYLPFAKVVDLRTTIWEYKQLPFILGNYIDVFPIDCFDKPKAELEDLCRHSRRLFYQYQATITDDRNLLDLIEYIRTKHFGSAARSLASFLYHGNPEKALKRYTDYIDANKGQTGDHCIYMTGKLVVLFRTEWLTDTVKVPFEDMEIAVPREYDAYLTSFYGDWRTPPSAKKQVATHGDVRYYINLKERLALDEVRRRLARGEKAVF